MKKKGFTLIELLAVIVILAVLALIAIPIIMNMINKARRAAAIDTAYGYVNSVEYSMNLSDIGANSYKDINIKDQEYDIDDPDLENIKIKGKKPDSGNIIIEKRKIKSGNFCIDSYKVEYDGKIAKIVNSNECKSGSGSEDPIDPEPTEIIVKDKIPCSLETETINEKEVFYIDSVEDMYSFSADVNNGNNYSEKIVILRNNLDFEDYNLKDKVCSDNDNTGGLTPINNFKGTFKGNAKTIENLIINRPNTDNIGIFGTTYNATIYGLKLKNIEINGKNNVGTLVGYANATSIKEIVLDNVEVEGTNNIGGIVGNKSGGEANNILVKDASVKASNTGGIIASGSNSGSTNSIIENGSLTALNKSNVSNNSKVYWTTKYKINGQEQASSLTNEQISDINLYQVAGLDTWIGGDNNETGSYFDYKDNTTKEIVLKSIETTPIPTSLDDTLDKSGEYYLIKNEADWKNFTAFNETDLKIKLTNNLNFSNKHFYIKDSFNSSTLKGGAKTISNVDINVPRNSGLDNVGIFRTTNNSNIYGLYLKNISLGGYNFVGSLIGYSNGTNTKEIVLDNVETKGVRHGGGLAGIVYSGTVNNILVKDASVDATDTGGIIVGGGNVTPRNSIIENGSLNAPNKSNVSNSYQVYWTDNYKIDNKGQSSSLTNTQISDINLYQVAGLDTWIGGDNNETGSYFDYKDNTSKEIVLKSTDNAPILTSIDDTLDKSGEYYLIKNETDWKNFTASNDANIKVKLTNNLDFSNKHFYVKENINGSTFNGGAKTIANADINVPVNAGLDTVGIFRSSQASNIYSLNLKNINLGGYNSVGTLVGGPNGTSIKEIVLDNVEVKGNNNIGGIAGNKSGGEVTNILVKDVSVDANNTGGILASGSNSGSTNSIIEKGSLKALNKSGVVNTSKVYWSTNYKVDNQEQASSLTSAQISDINLYQVAGLDTWIGGDNNETGTYFDYKDNTSNEIVLKSIETTPIPTSLDDTLDKSGEYYLIKNEADWKNFTALNTDNKKYKLANNLDFSNKHFYIKDSFNSSIFNGGAKTISNADINVPVNVGLDNVGIFRTTNNSNIYGLNLKNISLGGYNYVGSLIGYSNGTNTKEIVLDNVETKGFRHVGGLAGIVYGGTVTNILVKDASVDATDTGGIIVGGGNVTPRNSIIENGSLDALNKSNVSNAYQVYWSTNYKIDGTNQANGFDPSEINNIVFYSGKVETVTDGDINNTGYYYNYHPLYLGIYIVEK